MSINDLEVPIHGNSPWNGPFSKTQKHFKSQNKGSRSRKVETEEVKN